MGGIFGPVGAKKNLQKSLCALGQPIQDGNMAGCFCIRSKIWSVLGHFIAKNPPQKGPKMKMSFLGGERNFFVCLAENPFLKYPKLTGITSKITYPTLHLGEKVRCRLAFLAIFGPFRGHSSTKISPNGPKSPPTSGRYTAVARLRHSCTS